MIRSGVKPACSRPGMIRVCLLLFVAVVAGCPLRAQQSPPIPHLRKHGTATQLVVHGKPLLMLGGELGNSSASDTHYMNPMWARLKTMHLNTVLMPVYWELIEPEEGTYDFSLVDSLITAARKHDLHIVALWFGSWKNSMSCYAPPWVKTDLKRFPRARIRNGRAIEIMTPFSTANRDADAQAFTAFMRHLRAVDGTTNTVVMIQVENEIGMIPEARDYSPGAEQAFARDVPAELMTYLQNHKSSLTDELRGAWSSSGMKTSGTWEEVFGESLHTDEIFMAWYFARYANYVAAAGKKEYPLPMYVNAALIRPHYMPGQYPSAGPLPHLMDVWRAGASAIDFLAPDIYFKSFAEWVGKFDRDDNAMFIPEVDRTQSATNAFYAMARHNAMGYSPFSIESVNDPENSQFAKAYDVLDQLTPLILEYQGTRKMTGFLLDSAAEVVDIQLGDYIFTVKHEYTWPYASHREGETPRFGGLIVMTADDEFIIAGSGVVVTFQTATHDGSIAGIASIDEGAFVNGTWRAGRRLNGDQSHQGRHLYLPGGEYGIQKLRLYTYK
jgi:beta-galactosidase GanA